MEEDGMTKREDMDPFFVRKRKDKEAEWTKILQTTYPYRMNDKVDHEIATNKDDLIPLL